MRVITASIDGSAQVWDVATNLKLGDPFRHGDQVVSAMFDASGRRAITAAVDAGAAIWDVPIASVPTPDWLPELAEAADGRRLNPDDILEWVTWHEYATLETQLREIAASDPYSQWVHAFAANPIPFTARQSPSIPKER